jgi:hypothetical protein
MQHEDGKAFRDSLNAAYEMYGKGPLSKIVLRKWWELFRDWDFHVFNACLDQHLQQSEFPPKPSDLITIRDTLSGKPTADEAWALVLQAQDESQTIIWTEETAAASAVAVEILEAGDKVGARMAFKDAYNREMHRNKGPVQWKISLGTDQANRERVINQGVQQGRLKADKVQHLLPAPVGGGDIAGLLTGKVQESDVDNVELLEKWRGIKKLINE